MEDGQEASSCWSDDWKVTGSAILGHEGKWGLDLQKVRKIYNRKMAWGVCGGVLVAGILCELRFQGAVVGFIILYFAYEKQMEIWIH